MTQALQKADFSFLSDLLYEKSGLVVPETKTYLLRSRLEPIVISKGIESIEELVVCLRRNNDAALLQQVVEAMTTNESMFFRDKSPFETFEEFVLPNLRPARTVKKHLRVWSAACSSGQEPYSLVMLLEEIKSKLAGWTVEIVATDLSDEILDRAREGLYTKMEAMRGLPVQYLVRYFDQEGDYWRLKAEYRQRVNYSKFNLLDNPARLGTFDVVFCRNVLIYFDAGTKAKVLNAIAKQLSPDGYLFLGSSETVLGLETSFGLCKGRRGVFQRTDTSTSGTTPLKKPGVGALDERAA